MTPRPATPTTSMISASRCPLHLIDERAGASAHCAARQHQDATAKPCRELRSSLDGLALRRRRAVAARRHPGWASSQDFHLTGFGAVASRGATRDHLLSSVPLSHRHRSRAYRIIQEALTERTRHPTLGSQPSGSTTATTLVSELRDDGRGGFGLPATEWSAWVTSGCTLRQCRESEPRPGGGFGVGATLPSAVFFARAPGGARRRLRRWYAPASASISMPRTTVEWWEKAANGDEAVPWRWSTSPGVGDVGAQDIRMPGTDVLTATRRISPGTLVSL